MDLTDQQWTIIEPLFEEKRRPDGRGRPWRDARAVLNGVPWVLRTGAPWHDLPDRYAPYQTCHRRFQQWRKNGVFRDLLTCLAEDLRLRGKIDLTEGFIDASFTAAKKGGSVIGPTKRGKGNKIMAIVDRRSLPLAVHVACASPHEVRLVEATLEDRFIAPYPPRLIGDRAYDSDRLDAALRTSFGDTAYRPASGRPRAPDAGRPGAPTLQAALGRRTVLCLAAQLAAARHALVAARRELRGHAAARMHAHPAQPLMR